MNERLQELLKEWHEAGRADFEQRCPSLDYDTYSPKRAVIKRKYIYLDDGSSGAWILEHATGNIYNMTAYGVPDRRKHLGHVDTITGADLHRLRWWYRR